MHDQAFADATRPTPQRILRVPLIDYSLGHELILQRGRNLFTVGDIDKAQPLERRMAVIQAVSVCSRTWIENKRPDRWLGVWGLFLQFEDFDEAIEDFKNYRHEGSMFPPLWHREGYKPENELGSPLMACIYDYAADRFGLAAFDQPLGALQFGYFAHLEHAGAVEVQNAVKCQISSEIEWAEKQFAKEQEEKQCQH